MNKKVIKTFAFGVSIACGLAVSGLFASSASADDLASGNISYARSVFAPAYSYTSDSSNSEFKPAMDVKAPAVVAYSDSSSSEFEPAKDFKAPAVVAYSDSSSSEFEPAMDVKAPAVAYRVFKKEEPVRAYANYLAPAVAYSDSSSSEFEPAIDAKNPAVFYSDSSNSEFEPAIASPDDVTEPITDNDNMIKLAKLPDYNQSDEYLANLDNSQEYDVNVDDINDDVNVDDIDFEAIDLDNLGKFASEDVANRCKYTTGGDCAPLPPYASILDGKDHDADNNSGDIDDIDIDDDIDFEAIDLDNLGKFASEDVANRCKYTTGGDCAPLPPYASILDGKDHDADNNSGDIDDIDIDDFNVDNLDLDDLDGNRLDVVSNVDSNSNDNNDNSNESNTNDDSNSNNSNADNASNKSNTVSVVSERHDRLSDLHKEVSGRDSHNFAPTLPVPGSQYYYYHNN